MLSFTARVLSAEMVETRSTACANSLASSASDLVVAGRDHALIIGEGAVDQLGGEFHAAEGELDLGVRQRDLDRAVGVVQQPAQFGHRLARHDHARHVGRRRRAGRARSAPAGGRRSPPRAGARVLPSLRGVQIDAVQVEPRLLGRDREARLVDQPLQIVRGEAEAVGQRARRHLREIFLAAGRRARSGRCRPKPPAGRLRPSSSSACTWAPSGSLRTMS